MEKKHNLSVQIIEKKWKNNFVNKKNRITGLIIIYKGGGQFGTTNETEDEFFGNFIFEFNFSFFRNHLKTQIFNNFSSCEILFFQVVKLIFFYFANC